MNTVVHKINKLKSVTRLFICLGIALLVLVITLILKVQLLTSILITWASFSLLLILTSWTTFLSVSNVDLYLQAKEQDESSPIIFIIVLCSVCISLIGILILMRNSDDSLISKEIHRFVSLVSVALSWILLHTVCTLHYARLYYSDDLDEPNPKSGRLNFPDEDKPDYLDFAYFSFVIGMTFQVSDVEISSKKLRRFVLLHSLISFVFNTIIVALTISVLSNSGN